MKALLYGAPIGMLGGLIGLGGAEFRLPVLKAVFHYPTHIAIALNLAVSLVTLVAALAIRLRLTSAGALAPWAPASLGIVAGAMFGAYGGAAWAQRLSVARLERLILVLLVGIGLALIGEAFLPWRSAGIFSSPAVQLPAAGALGIVIGIVSSLLGVAGGELIIPTLVFGFGADIKAAGTLSVLISLPTVSVGLWRHARKGAALRQHLGSLVAPMGAGSVVGALAGGALVAYVPGGALKLVLGVILILSALRIFRSQSGADDA